MEKKKTKVGDKSGKLTVIEILGRYKPNSMDSYCIAKCECGNEEIIRCTNINVGRRTMCNQCKKEEMKNKKIIKTGTKFGKLTVLECIGQIKESDKHIYYKIKCECGEIEQVSGTSLRIEKRMCCKCSLKERMKHGLSKTKLFGIYRGIKRRCYNANDPNYKYYGNRGITMCDEWKDNSSSFFEWALNNGYEEGLSIDRIDNNGNYEPSNCRWATRTEQNNNQRSNRKITYNGETHGIYEWERIVGLPRNILGTRIRAGWDIERAITTPLNKKHSHKHIL